MFTLNEFVQPKTIEEAYNILLSDTSNAILGGCAYLKLGSRKIPVGIDLSELELNYIKETENHLEIGAMTTLRELETHPLLNQYFNKVLPAAVSNIIGVQFRNVATVGASIYSRYGFSDLLTALLSLDTEIELYHAGRMELREFLEMPVKKDILTKVFIKRNDRRAAYQSMRNSVSDYPLLNAAVSVLEDQWVITVGARPAKAQIASNASQSLNGKGYLTPEEIDAAAELAAQELSFGTNRSGSAEYRQALCKVLVKRGIKEVLQCKSN